MLQKLTEVCIQYSSLEASHKVNHSDLQLKPDDANQLIQAKLSTMVKLINEVKKTQYDLLQSTEKDLNFDMLQRLFTQNNTTLQQQFDDTNSLVKQVKIEMTEQSERHIKDIENKVQSCLSQTLSKGTDHDNKRDKELEMAIENLQKCAMQLQNELKQQNSMSNQNKVETLVDTKTAKVQKVLSQESAEKEEKTPLSAFMENHNKLDEIRYKLQKSKQKLEESNQELLHQVHSTEKQVEIVLKQIEAEKKEFEATAVLYEAMFQNVRFYYLLFSIQYVQ